MWLCKCAQGSVSHTHIDKVRLHRPPTRCGCVDLNSNDAKTKRRKQTVYPCFWLLHLCSWRLYWYTTITIFIISTIFTSSFDKWIFQMMQWKDAVKAHPEGVTLSSSLANVPPFCISFLFLFSFSTCRNVVYGWSNTINILHIGHLKKHLDDIVFHYCSYLEKIFTIFLVCRKGRKWLAGQHDCTSSPIYPGSVVW